MRVLPTRRPDADWQVQAATVAAADRSGLVFNRFSAFAVLLLVGIGLWKHMPLLTLGGLLALAVLGAERLWIRFCLAGVEYERDVSPRRAFWGEEVGLHLRIANRKLLPLTWLLVEDRVPDRLPINTPLVVQDRLAARTFLKSLLPMLPYEQLVQRYTVRCRQRGVFQFGPGHLEAGDLLGYTSRTREFEDVQRLIVYPKVFDLDMPTPPSMRMVGPRPVDRVILTDPSRTVGVRTYQPGDPLRQLDWRASARTPELMVRVFEPTTDPAVALFLNSELPRRAADTHDPPELEFCVSLAVSMSKWLLDRGFPVGLFGNGDLSGPGAVRIPVSRAPDQLHRIMETLALATPFGPVRRTADIWWQDIGAHYVNIRPPLAQVLLREAALLPYETSVMVVTAGFDRDLVTACTEVQRKRKLVIYYVQTSGSLDDARLFGGVEVIPVPYPRDWEDLDRLQLAA